MRTKGFVLILALFVAGGAGCASFGLNLPSVYAGATSIEVLNSSFRFDTIALMSEEDYWSEIGATSPAAARVKTHHIEVVHFAGQQMRDSLGRVRGSEKTDYQVPGAIVSGLLGHAKRIEFFIDHDVAAFSFANTVTYWQWLSTHEFGHVLDPREFKSALPQWVSALDSIRGRFEGECAEAKPTDSGYLKSLRIKQGAGKLTVNEVAEERIADRIGLYLNNCPADMATRSDELQDQYRMAGAYLDWLHKKLGYARFDNCQARRRRFELFSRYYIHLYP